MQINWQFQRRVNKRKCERARTDIHIDRGIFHTLIVNNQHSSREKKITQWKIRTWNEINKKKKKYTPLFTEKNPHGIVCNDPIEAHRGLESQTFYLFVYV